MFSHTAAGYEYTVAARYGQPFDCFYAFVWWSGSLWSAHRRHVIFDPDAWPKDAENHVSDIVLTRWDWGAETLIACDEMVIGPGNDPRVALVGGRPIVLYRAPFGSAAEYFLYDVAAKRNIQVIIEDPFFRYGKNWVPFDDDGGLGAVHGFDPFRLLRIDPETGLGRVVQESRQVCTPRAFHDRYCMFRGGTNPVRVADRLVGFGHATFDSYRHHPFLWQATQGELTSLAMSFDFDPLIRAGFNIIDPTSLFQDGSGNLYVALCCSERDWFYEQMFLNLVLPVTVTNVSDEAVTLQVDTRAFLARPAVQLRTADRLPSTLPSQAVPYGGRRVEGKSGFVAFGPYESLAAGRYRFSFRYRSEATADIHCGWADVCICVPGSSKPVMRIDLPGTEGRIVTAHLECDMAMAAGQVHETRVYSNGVAALAFYDIATMRLAPLDCAGTYQEHPTT